jgi:AraC-like DNA-binding protein
LQYPLQNGSVVFVRSGTFAAHLGKRTFVVDANYAVFGDDGDILEAVDGSKTSCTCTAIRFSGDAKVFSPLAVLCEPAAYLAQARLLNVVRFARGDTAIDDAAERLISLMSTMSQEAQCCDERHTRTVCAIKELMSRSLSKPLSLPELANRFYLSPFTISRWFHQETGVSLRLYMQRLRLRRALTFMLDERRSLTAIALELGFYDEPHFSKAFHAEFGVSPGLALTMS